MPLTQAVDVRVAGQGALVDQADQPSEEVVAVEGRLWEAPVGDGPAARANFAASSKVRPR